MTNLTTIFGGAAIFTTLGLVWSKIAFIFSRLSGLVIFTARIDGNIPKALEIYLVKNFKKSPLQPLTFNTFRDYIKSIQKRHVIGYESVNFKDKTVFWKGWKPLIVSIPGKDNQDQSATPSGQNKYSASITFIRGTFNIDELLINSLELFNERNIKNEKISRFTIFRHFGTSGRKDQNRDKPNGPQAEVSNSTDIFLGDKRILKYKIDDIGEDQDDKKSFNILAFPKEINTLVDEIERWKNSEKWYRKKSIPWKRGWLLFGGAGCVLAGTKIKIRKKTNSGKHKKIIVQ